MIVNININVFNFNVDEEKYSFEYYVYENRSLKKFGTYVSDHSFYGDLNDFKKSLEEGMAVGIIILDVYKQ